MNIRAKDVELTPEGAWVAGVMLPWSSLYKVLDALPEAARIKLNWFGIMAPPSACALAIDESKGIVKALFGDTSATEDPEQGFQDA